MYPVVLKRIGQHLSRIVVVFNKQDGDRSQGVCCRAVPRLRNIWRRALSHGLLIDCPSGHGILSP
jgi:hypothetical protein